MGTSTMSEDEELVMQLEAVITVLLEQDDCRPEIVFSILGVMRELEA